MKRLSFLFIILLLTLSTIISQKKDNNSEKTIKLTDQLPIDKEITQGTLQNGFKYFIKRNPKPVKRAYLQLIVNAGSLLEDDNQLGLAHFTQHMAFDSSKKFSKKEKTDYLKSIGMKFGPDINAYTSFDETVYMFELPTDSINTLQKGFQLIEDIAHNLSFDDAEINKERGAVKEEWGSGRGAGSRMRDKQFPILLNDSRYAERLPIGKKETIENFGRDVLKRYYKDWYRPDLMAVIVVGDVDVKWVEKQIKSHFSKLTNPQSEKERKYYSVPNDGKVSFAIATDKEAAQTSINIYHKLEATKTFKTASDLRENLMENIFNSMFNWRLREATIKPDPPFIMSTSGVGKLIRNKDFYTLSALLKEGGIKTGLKSLYIEEERIKKYGFTKTEFDRAKDALTSYWEQMYNEKDKTESSVLSSNLVKYFLNDETMISIEDYVNISKQLINEIKIDDVNNLINNFITDKDNVVLVNAPEKDGLKTPDENELRRIIAEAKKENIEPYNEKFVQDILLPNPPKGSEIISEKEIPELNVTELKLKNGVKVVLKPTNFSSEVHITAFNPGGHSLLPDSDFIPAATASQVVTLGGVGSLDAIQLRKILAGKHVKVSPALNEVSEGITGLSSEKDVETLMQLIYLYITSPRADSAVYATQKDRMKSFIENRNANPESAFIDTVQVTLGNYNIRREPLSVAAIEKMDLEKSMRIYKERFADASGFTFIFVGNFKNTVIRPLIEKYLGGLPSLNRNETWKNLNINPPKGIISKVVRKGIESKSLVNLTFTGPFDWNNQNIFDLNAMRSVLEIKLREAIKEEKEGTYGVQVTGAAQSIPNPGYTFSINFECAPERVNELVKIVFRQIDTLKNNQVPQVYITKVKDALKREQESSLKSDSFWLSALNKYYFNKMDPKEILETSDRIDKLSYDAVKKAAKKYLNTENYIKVVLLPEKTK